MDISSIHSPNFVKLSLPLENGRLRSDGDNSDDQNQVADIFNGAIEYAESYVPALSRFDDCKGIDLSAKPGEVQAFDLTLGEGDSKVEAEWGMVRVGYFKRYLEVQDVAKSTGESLPNVGYYRDRNKRTLDLENSDGSKLYLTTSDNGAHLQYNPGSTGRSLVEAFGEFNLIES